MIYFNGEFVGGYSDLHEIETTCIKVADSDKSARQKTKAVSKFNGLTPGASMLLSTYFVKNHQQHIMKGG